jgi:3-keto-disaccharide hydrolase
MRKLLAPSILLVVTILLALVVLRGSALAQRYLHGIIWPEPPVVTPGEGSGPPSDAIVLFNSKDFDAWEGAKGWKVDADGGFTVKGNIKTRKSFGDCQLHVEFASPKPARGRGQGRGNNGIGLMAAHYEIQVLDSYDNKTYPEGQCASVYNQTPPMVNASRRPGEWQSYDIIFTAPRFEQDGKLLKPAYVTVLYNGVVVQNHTEIKGETFYDQPNVYSKHADKLPLVLMYHGNPVRFRNIWIREIKELEGKPGGKKGLEGK